MSFTTEIITGLEFEEADLNNPVFTWIDGNDYPCVPSVAEISRVLDTGGFVIDKMLTLSARLLDDSQNDIYASALPQPQQLITFNGEQFRIITTKKHPTGAYLRITAMGVTRGI